jgi:uncharacterized membrane-anchored protein YitT (DUF2179 family)
MKRDTAIGMWSLKKILLRAQCSLCSSLYALALNLFWVGNHIAPGGFSGLATVLNYLFGWPVGLVVFLSNLPLFAFAWRRLGIKFCFLSLMSTVLCRS